MKKLYYSIGEVSDLTGLKPYVLRYWETEFPMLSPGKNRAGNRIYREKDIRLIFYIKHLLYNEKYTIDGARKKLKHMTLDEIPEMVPGILSEGDEQEEKRETTVKVEDGQLQRYKEAMEKIRLGLKEILKILDEGSVEKDRQEGE